MSNKPWNTIAIILLIGATALYGSKTVPAIVSASHLVRHGGEVKEIRVHLMRDHKLYVEEITQGSPSRRTCQMSLAVLPEPAFHRIEKLIGSPQFRAIQNREHRAQTEPGQDEVWHIAFRDGPTQFFTFNPPKSRPPANFVEWFDEARRLQPSENVPLNADSYRCTLFSQEMADAWQR
jgi:hypothetical protein